jgi:hypothetical protein
MTIKTAYPEQVLYFRYNDVERLKSLVERLEP